MSDLQWIKRLAGKFIVFDGPDGSGKSTQLRRLRALVESQGVDVCEVREPGGTVIGEKIRQVLLDPSHDMMDLRCEMLLYMASRAQLVHECIEPARARGQLVLADRFVSSTLAYQGAAGGLAEADIRAVAEVAVGRCRPDLYLIFDLDAFAAVQRLMQTKKTHRYVEIVQPSLFSDRIELKGIDYQQKVREGFLDQAKRRPENYVVISAVGDPDMVFSNACNVLKNKFSPHGKE